jgi:hypothetical protein
MARLITPLISLLTNNTLGRSAAQEAGHQRLYIPDLCDCLCREFADANFVEASI